ncbi:hypothetical protein [Treponema phagedenis]|nr:hypothetical protein [Treponema phagedenis]
MSKLLAEPAVCEGEMLSEAAANLLRASIPLNPLATEERIQELKHELEPMDCILPLSIGQAAAGRNTPTAHTRKSSTLFLPPMFLCRRATGTNRRQP